jgi:Zn ribbon nucleic-acid-binding protein
VSSVDQKEGNVNESVFLHMAPCPNCGSRDNLGVYSDHVYCFGCSYYNSEKHPQKFIKRKKDDRTTSSVSLPADFSSDIRDCGLHWLGQYNVTAGDIRTHHIGWSEQGVVLADGTLLAPLLIFPVFDSYGNLLCWQGRNFGESASSGRKYYTRGGRDLIHLLGKGSPVVVVEDMVSAIKLSKICSSIPLFGSNVNLDFLTRLHRITDSFIIWLDQDKHKDSLKYQQRAKQFFNYCGVISTPLDPKEYDLSELRTILGACK